MTGPTRLLSIQMITPTLYSAGMEHVVVNLASGLANRGHQVGIICTTEIGKLGERAEANGVEVRLVSSPGWKATFFPKTLTAAFRELRPDVVHPHGGVWALSAIAARKARIDCVVHTVHGKLDRERWRNLAYQRLGNHFTDRVVTVSESLEAHMIRGSWVNPDRISTIHNGVDTNRFHPVGDQRQYPEGLTDENVVVGIVARFSAVKNHANLIRAFELVHRARPHARLVCVGEGELENELRQQIAAAGLEAVVLLTGPTSRADAAYRTFDIFTLPSDREGASVSIIEAMASGLPVVATQVGGSPALLDHGTAGHLVPPRTPTALAESLIALIDDDRRRNELGERARKRTVEHYSLEAMVTRYEQVYYDVHNQKKGSS